MLRADQHRIRHTLDAAHEAVSFAAGKSRADLDGDRVLSLALVECIEIVGEAASAVSQESHDRHPEIPWRNIIAMRNRLIHGYFSIDLDRVWDTITDDLPPLIAALQAIPPAPSATP